MINVDWSIVPAILIFILTVLAVHFLLLKPVLRIQEQREMRTSGLISESRRNLDHHLRLFDEYQATIKNSRLDGYRLVEKARADAMLYRKSVLDRARRSAEQMIHTARGSVSIQVSEARTRLETEAQDLARRITLSVLQRPA
jgi:F0F1-type ATP synthase membrane subunit b/b'